MFAKHKLAHWLWTISGAVVIMLINYVIMQNSAVGYSEIYDVNLFNLHVLSSFNEIIIYRENIIYNITSIITNNLLNVLHKSLARVCAYIKELMNITAVRSYTYFIELLF